MTSKMKLSYILSDSKWQRNIWSVVYFIFLLSVVLPPGILGSSQYKPQFDQILWNVLYCILSIIPFIPISLIIINYIKKLTKSNFVGGHLGGLISSVLYSLVLLGLSYFISIHGV